jgi:hypothetical protein
LLPCKSGVGTPKAKGDNPDRKLWSPRCGGPAPHPSQKYTNAKRPKDDVFRLRKTVYSWKIPKINK